MEVPQIAKSTARFLLGSRWYETVGGLYVRWLEPMDSKYRKSQKRLRKLKDKHRGEHCFLIGNGPSLKNTDLSLLRNEYTIGLNRIYLLFDELGFTTTYHVTVNALVLEQCGKEIAQIPCPKFISWDARRFVNFTDDSLFLHSRHQVAFYTDITRGVWEGATVTYVAMQVAYYLGFQQVILVGVDHSFATQGKPHTTVVSEGDDPNHFHPGYFGKGFRWQLPDLETSELAYRMAKWVFEISERQIIDATVGGKLEVFPKVDYQSLFESSADMPTQQHNPGG